MDASRRKLIASIGATLLCAPGRSIFAQNDNITSPVVADDNFGYVYRDENYRREFKDFLVNVFHLFPEDEFHRLIHERTTRVKSDQDAYLGLQAQLDEIKPFLGDLRYALPALVKQKAVLAGQTVELLGTERRFDGYLEIGSTGRYLDSLEEQLDIEGQRVLVAERAPTRTLVDLLDRGQFSYAGDFLSLNDYRTELASIVAPGSIDLVTVYIGFHHCPLPLRESFIGSIRDSMSPGGALVVRDHNVHNEKMWKMVALAHDVFNMGTGETWQYNERELRHFYSLQDLDRMLTRAGFKSLGRKLFQQGDPTLNALMLYKKV